MESFSVKLNFFHLKKYPLSEIMSFLLFGIKMPFYKYWYFFLFNALTRAEQNVSHFVVSQTCLLVFEPLP